MQFHVHYFTEVVSLLRRLSLTRSAVMHGWCSLILSESTTKVSKCSVHYWRANKRTCRTLYVRILYCRRDERRANFQNRTRIFVACFHGSVTHPSADAFASSADEIEKGGFGTRERKEFGGWSRATTTAEEGAQQIGCWSYPNHHHLLIPRVLIVIQTILDKHVESPCPCLRNCVYQ